MVGVAGVVCCKTEATPSVACHCSLLALLSAFRLSCLLVPLLSFCGCPVLGLPPKLQKVGVLSWLAWGCKGSSVVAFYISAWAWCLVRAGGVPLASWVVLFFVCLVLSWFRVVLAFVLCGGSIDAGGCFAGVFGGGSVVAGGCFSVGLCVWFAE